MTEPLSDAGLVQLQPEEKKGGEGVQTLEEVRAAIRSAILSNNLPTDTLDEEMDRFTEEELRAYARDLLNLPD